MRHSRNDMNDSLLSLITEALVGRVLTSERLVMEHAMLIAILHANVGMEVGESEMCFSSIMCDLVIKNFKNFKVPKVLPENTLAIKKLKYMKMLLA